MPVGTTRDARLTPGERCLVRKDEVDSAHAATRKAETTVGRVRHLVPTDHSYHGRLNTRTSDLLLRRALAEPPEEYDYAAEHGRRCDPDPDFDGTAC